MNEELSTVNILWTGGWDSTYRMVELSMREICVQPVYVEDPGRKSVPYELKAMKDITALLEAKEKTKAKFLPLKIVKMTDIPENQEITDAYLSFRKEMTLRNESPLGTQYDWLARLALEYPGIELGLEKGLEGHSRIRDCFRRHGKLIESEDGFFIDKEHSSRELVLVFGNMKFPILEKTELEMRRNISQWGYEDVMSHIWFCHRPIHGKPCGLCNPCKQKMEAEMYFLLPEVAQKRNIRMCSIEKKFGKKAASVYRKIAKRLAR